MDSSVGADFSAVLGLVDLRRWGKRAAVFSLVARRSARAPELGAFVGQRDVAEATASDRRYAYRLLRSLVDERVLVLAQPGAGRRPARVRINPNMRAWRGVPWSVTPEHAAWIVLGGDRRSQARNRRFVTRSHSASQPDLVTRSHSASQNPENGPVEALCDAIYSASQDFRSDAPWDRVTNDSAPRADTSSLERSKDLSLEEPSSSSADVQRVIEAIRAATGCDVYGRLVDQVAALVRDAGSCEAVLAAVPDVDPGGMQAPAFVHALRRRLDGGAQLGADRIENLRRQLKSLDEVIAVARADGFEPDAQLAERAAVNLRLEQALARPLGRDDGLG